jgi:hypothetical protein
MTRPRRLPLRGFAVLALLGILTLGGTAARAADPSPAPSLTADASVALPAGVFAVAGTGFTAGGPVYLAIYDEMGAQLYETRWVTADAWTPIKIGSGNGPERSPVDGGMLYEAFGQLCGAQAMMRALDEGTATWSNWLPVRPTCANGGSGPH